MREYTFYRGVCEMEWGCGWGDRGEERRGEEGGEFFYSRRDLWMGMGMMGRGGGMREEKGREGEGRGGEGGRGCR